MSATKLNADNAPGIVSLFKGLILSHYWYNLFLRRYFISHNWQKSSAFYSFHVNSFTFTEKILHGKLQCTVTLKGILMQIWKSANVFVFT